MASYTDKLTLAAWNELADASAAAGNCKLVFGAYTGDGTYGISNRNLLEFEGKPVFLLVRNRSVAAQDYMLLAPRGVFSCEISSKYGNGSSVTLSWYEHSVLWHGNNAANQLNTNGHEYAYVALTI